VQLHDFSTTTRQLCLRFGQRLHDSAQRTSLLVTTPIATRGFTVRTLILAIEATFSIVLWAMISRTKDYGMPPLRPWSLEIMEDAGCCSHFALAEHATKEAEGLTLEQITAKELEMK